MFKKIKELFSKEEEQPREMNLSDVPSWLDTEMKKIRANEETKVSGSRGPVMKAISELRVLVPDLGSGDHEGTGFVKLEKVAENSLPLYKKSMMSALSRPFPEKTEEFYHAVAECLKGCIKSSQGPGRYLVRVFPEEMKLIQSEVSRLGKEVNTMNPVFAESRSNHIALEKIKSIHHSLIHVIREHDDAEKNLPDLLAGTEKLKQEQKDLSRQIATAENDPRFARYTGFTLKEQEFLQEREKLTGEMAVLSGMVIHVMRRAEKVAHKDRNDVIGKKIHTLAETLSKNEMPAAADLIIMISGVLPSVIEMVASGEITLKNRGEQEFFTDGRALPLRLEEMYRKSEEINRQIMEIRDEIGNDAFIREKEALEKRYRQKKLEYHESERNITDSRHKAETTAKEIPELIHQIEEHLTQYSCECIRISLPDSGHKVVPDVSG